MKISEICKILEDFAPLANQESYDNSGLTVGDKDNEVKKLLITLDVTPEVMEEAILTGCNLIISHHPVLFQAIKKINPQNYTGNLLMKAIENKISIYAIHTNLDNVSGGVSFKLAEKLGLKEVRVLGVKKNTLQKLVTFIPIEQVEKVCDALFDAGAGKIGNYDQCSFQIDGTGSFRPSEQANPTIGKRGTKEFVKETRVEVIFPSHKSTSIIDALKQSHPYEEVAYYLTGLENENQECGSGAIGILEKEMNYTDFLVFVKKSLSLRFLRHSQPQPHVNISTVAVCGGAGSFLVENAIKQEAQAFITADIKYHSFFDAINRILLIDAGHFETEIFTIELLINYLSKHFKDKVEIVKTKNISNPVYYFN